MLFNKLNCTDKAVKGDNRLITLNTEILSTNKTNDTRNNVSNDSTTKYSLTSNWASKTHKVYIYFVWKRLGAVSSDKAVGERRKTFCFVFFWLKNIFLRSVSGNSCLKN